VLRRPVLTSFLVAVVVALAFGGYMLAESRTVDEQPFIVFYSLVALPIAWFFAWIFLATFAWWLEITAEPPRES
jgi:ABC-type dipeptide/oligopeptide/nickel transport system permease component